MQIVLSWEHWCAEETKTLKWSQLLMHYVIIMSELSHKIVTIFSPKSKFLFAVESISPRSLLAQVQQLQKILLKPRKPDQRTPEAQLLIGLVQPCWRTKDHFEGTTDIYILILQNHRHWTIIASAHSFSA